MSRAPAERAAWTGRGLARAMVIACVALGTGAGLGYLVTHEPAPRGEGDGGPPRPPKPRPAGRAERALLAPLAEGGALGDFDIREIQAVSTEGVVRVVCRKDRATVRLDVALAALDDDGPEPPAVSGRYAVFYSLKNASPDDGERLAKALAAILTANAAVPPPPGMAPFTPRARELPPI